MSIIISSPLKARGLDYNSGKVPWQMVPVGGQRALTIKKADWLTAHVRDPKYLKIEEKGSTLYLTTHQVYNDYSQLQRFDLRTVHFFSRLQSWRESNGQIRGDRKRSK